MADICCKTLFDSDMFFTSYGVCYNTKKEIVEMFPFQFSAVEIWVSPQNNEFEYPGKLTAT